ncbi:MAG: hypothetical protein DIJKHBIC_02257 [Thermoanaerobaculia bacterium]|nr:hypothetical protein [Thermoanaerobaculia bacterium]
MTGIGLLNETALHASLKQWYSRPGDRFEVPVGRFVIDIVRDDLLIEVQTRNFSAIKPKLTALARSHRIRLVYPIIVEKWIVRPASGRPTSRRPTSGEDRLSTRRRSPRKGRLEDVFREAVSIPLLLCHRNFSLHVLRIRVEETRRPEEKRRWRSKGWTVEERRLLEVVDQRLFQDPSDWRDLLPEGLESFTTIDLASSMGIGRDLAQKAAYCLREAGVIEQAGKRGRSLLYRLASTP